MILVGRPLKKSGGVVRVVANIIRVVLYDDKRVHHYKLTPVGCMCRGVIRVVAVCNNKVGPHRVTAM